MTARIGPAALAALRAAVVGHDHVDLGASQLPRAVYEEATAVLAAVGAPWHKGRKRHVFGPAWDPVAFATARDTGVSPVHQRPPSPRPRAPTPARPPTPAQTRAAELFAEGWRVTSRRFRMIARLPPGETGLQAYSRAAGRPAGQGEYHAGELYRAVYAEREGFMDHAPMAVIIELARLAGDARIAAQAGAR